MIDAPNDSGNEDRSPSLTSRVASLEEQVARFHAELTAARVRPPSTDLVRTPVPPKASESALEKVVIRVEIALLVIGCVYLFK